MTKSSVQNGNKAKCDAIYLSIVELSEGGNQSLFDLAQCFIDGYDPEKLRILLKSVDEGLVIDGLFIVSEIGDLARNYSAELALLAKSSDPEIQSRAIKLAAIYS